MNLHTPDLSAIDLDGGIIRLTQRDYAGEDAVIDLHSSQLRHVAECAGLLAPTAAWPRNFASRLRRIQKQADYLADLLDSIPCFPPQPDLPEEVKEALRLVEMLDDLADDFDITVADDVTPTVTPPVTPTVTASVTPSSNAERQKRYRERQRELREGAQ